MCAAESSVWPVRRIEEVVGVNPRIDKKTIPDDLPVIFVPMSAVGAGTGRIQIEQSRFACEVKKGYTVFRTVAIQIVQKLESPLAAAFSGRLISDDTLDPAHVP